MADSSQKSVVLPFVDNSSENVSIQVLATQDDVQEEEECLVFSLTINETQLDVRDRGEVDLDISVTLARLQDVRFTCIQSQSIGTIVVNCDGNFLFDEITCSFDGLTPEPCKIMA